MMDLHDVDEVMELASERKAALAAIDVFTGDVRYNDTLSMSYESGGGLDATFVRLGTFEITGDGLVDVAEFLAGYFRGRVIALDRKLRHLGVEITD